MLAMSPGRVVPHGALITGIWGEAPPRSVRQSVYTYIAGLRRALDPGRGRREASSVLPGGPEGYALRVEPDRVDACLFARRLAEARKTSGESRPAVLGQALAMWNGPPLAGVPGPFAEMERIRLEELRLSALELRCSSLLELDRPDEALADLRELTILHPLRERFHELLMTALHRLGRRAEALEAFERARRILAEELGVDPGPGLRSRHELILRDRSLVPPQGRLREEPPARRQERPVPRQLPRDLTGFVGRSAEIVRLRSLLAPWDESAPGAVAAVTGPPGVGKSALAIHVAHKVGDRFPDGRLYANLRGATPNVERLSPHEVLGAFLRALGVPTNAIPADLDEAAALWRTTLSGRRVLVVLDDAAGPAQVRPLLSLPPGNAVVVTSRESLSPLDDCVQVPLARLATSEAAAMIAKLVGAGRCAADPNGATRLVRLCDGLPLALRIAAARLIDAPGWTPAALADRLEDERRRLHELETGDLAVRSSLMTSWVSLRDSERPLDRLAAEALALLGLLHVPDVTADAAGALLSVPPARAEQALERLAAAHLVDSAAPGRYHMHDLVRLFTEELAPRDRRAPLLSVLGHYAATAQRAAVLTDPHRVQAVAPPVEAPALPLADAAEAQGWLAAEEANLVAAAAQATADPDDDVAKHGVALAFALHWRQHMNLKMREEISLNRQVLEVAARLGDDRMALEAHNHMASGLTNLERHSEALEHLHRQLVLARRLGDRFCEQRAHGNIAMTLLTSQRHTEALRHAGSQLAIAEAIGSEVGRRYALYVAGMTHDRLGQHDQAEACLKEALSMASRVGDRTHQVIISSALADALVGQGRIVEAMDLLRESQAMATAMSLKGRQFECSIGLARACRLAGDLRGAMDHLGQAARHLRGVREGDSERKLREELEALESARGPRDGIDLTKII